MMASLAGGKLALILEVKQDTVMFIQTDTSNMSFILYCPIILLKFNQYWNGISLNKFHIPCRSQIPKLFYSSKIFLWQVPCYCAQLWPAHVPGLVFGCRAATVSSHWWSRWRCHWGPCWGTPAHPSWDPYSHPWTGLTLQGIVYFDHLTVLMTSGDM